MTAVGANQPMMTAAVLHGPNDLRVEQIPRPAPGPGEVLVRVMVSGICGSDLPRVLAGGAHFYPLVLGHEFSGIVAERGAGVSTAVGTRVAGAPLLPCRDCEHCERGHFSQCGQYSFLGSRINGAWAQYVVVPETNVLPIADSISFESAAMIEPSSVARHAFSLAEYAGGGRVAVVGAGNIGVMAIQWARILGAEQITAFDVDDLRLQTATQLGAHLVVRPDQESDLWLDATEGQGFDLVIESSGVAETFAQTLQLVAKKGQIAFVGTPTRAVSFEPSVFELLNRKEAKIVGSWMSYSDPFPGLEWTETISELESGRLVCEDFVAARIPLNDADQAFDLFRADEPVRGKVLLCDAGYLATGRG
ncbi:galactitol-1-phosphate 5-dehydrogenase [Microbacterium sp. A588]